MQVPNRLVTDTAPQDDGGDVAEETSCNAANSSVLPSDGITTMDRISSNIDSFNENDQIKRWQESTFTYAEEQDTDIIARLCQGVLDSLAYFNRVIAGSMAKRQENTLRRCYATLKLWADGHDIPNGNLDRILERSKHLQHTTLAVLHPLCLIILTGIKRCEVPVDEKLTMAQLLEKTTEICKQVKLLLSNFNESTSDSDSSDSSDSDASGDDIINSGMNSVVEDVRNYTGCLLDLSAAFECPANDIEKEVASSIVNVEERAAHDYHAQLLQAKFPSAQTELIHRLGETSWNRYQRMVQERESNANAQIQVEVCIYQSKESRSFKAASEFQDSGLGTSLPSAPSISYAETIISFMTSIGGGERVHIPPLSIEAKSGARFECNACGKQIQATTNRDWRKHLFADLQPYTCFYANCSWSTTPFVDRQLWSRHLELDHELGPAWNTFECPLCLEMTEPGKSAILIHFARHMEDIALAALPRDVESDAESDSLSECTTSTFGNRIEAPEDALRETSSNVKDTNVWHLESCSDKYPCDAFDDIVRFCEKGERWMTKEFKPTFHPDKCCRLKFRTEVSSDRWIHWDVGHYTGLVTGPNHEPRICVRPILGSTFDICVIKDFCFQWLDKDVLAWKEWEESSEVTRALVFQPQSATIN